MRSCGRGYIEMDVSIIIVNYNTKELTSNCLASAFEKTEAKQDGRIYSCFMQKVRIGVVIVKSFVYVLKQPVTIRFSFSNFALGLFLVNCIIDPGNALFLHTKQLIFFFALAANIKKMKLLFCFYINCVFIKFLMHWQICNWHYIKNRQESFL